MSTDSTSHINPSVKAGDKIILLKHRNGYQQYEGTVGTVVGNRIRASKHNFTAQFIDPNTGNKISLPIYYTAPTDEFCMASREAQAKAKKEKLENLEKEIETLKEEIEFLEKYESEEEYTAAKLSELMEAHGATDDPAEKLKLMTEMLKKMKSTSLL
jgi:hypothetical protein